MRQTRVTRFLGRIGVDAQLGLFRPRPAASAGNIAGRQARGRRSRWWGPVRRSPWTFFSRYAGSGGRIRRARFQDVASCRIRAWRAVLVADQPPGDPPAAGATSPGQLERRVYTGLPRVARAAVQQGAEPLAAGVVDLGAGRPGPVRLPRGQSVASAAKALMASRTLCEALGDPRGPRPVDAGQEDLAAAQREGIGGADAGRRGGPFLTGQGPDEEGRVHPADDDEPPSNPRGQA